jgi:uncharacterized protein
MIDNSEDPSSSHISSPRQGSTIELVAVFGFTVGIPLAMTLGTAGAPALDYGQGRLVSTVVIEVLVVALFWPWLASRGWSFRRIAGAPVPFDVLRGVGLVAVVYAAYYVSAITWAIVVPGIFEQESALPTGAASAWAVLLVALVNPVVEEFLWLAYGFTALRRFGRWAAIIASVALRTAIHAGLGVFALISIVPLGLVFTIYYSRTKRLWPIVAAHALFDVIGLLQVIQ